MFTIHIFILYTHFKYMGCVWIKFQESATAGPPPPVQIYNQSYSKLE